MDCLLEARNLSKSFSGVRVLNNVSLELRSGEVHAVMGENGAGKSTLMKILAGLHVPDSGEVRLAGRPVSLGNPHASLAAGISMIHQELMPFRNLTVAENILIGQEPVRWVGGWLNKRLLHSRAKEVLSRLGVDLSTRRRVGELRVAEIQVVEIAKALAHNARVIIMDEPTSALTERETQALFELIQDLRNQGVAVVYISHKFEEVFRLADRITVLRDGSHVATRTAEELTSETLISLMVGRELSLGQVRPAAEKGEVALEVRDLRKRGCFRGINFQVRRGEIVGLAGLMGAGRTEVVNAIYGLDPADAGEIQINGSAVRIRHPGDALRIGIGLVTEDRKEFGLVPTMRVRQNLTLAALRGLTSFGVLAHSREASAADDSIRSLGVRGAGRDSEVDRLSGGNQQKVVLGRTLLPKPGVLLLDEPTRGIDVGAKAEIHRLIAELVRGGKAVVLVSSELPELLALSDRILVMRQGRIVAEVAPRQTSSDEILKYAIPQ